MNRLAMVAAALSLLVPSVAFPCGSSSSGSSDSGSSGGGGGGSSGDSDDSGDDYDSDSGDSGDGGSTGPRCDQASVILGGGGCRVFGWYGVERRPRLRLELGTSLHRFSLAGVAFLGHAEHDRNVSYRLLGEQMSNSGLAGATTFDLRITGAIGRRGFFGFQGSIGGLSMIDRRPVTDGPLTLLPRGGIFGTAGAVAGVVHATRRWSVRGEVEVGGRFSMLEVESHYGECVDTSTIHDGRWQVRPRVTAEAWLSPWVTAGAGLGSNLLQRGDVSGSVFLGLHLRSFDGRLGRR